MNTLTQQDKDFLLLALTSRANTVIRFIADLKDCGIKDTTIYEAEAEKCYVLIEKLKQA